MGGSTDGIQPRPGAATPRPGGRAEGRAPSRRNAHKPSPDRCRAETCPGRPLAGAGREAGGEGPGAERVPLGPALRPTGTHLSAFRSPPGCAAATPPPPPAAAATGADPPAAPPPRGGVKGQPLGAHRGQPPPSSPARAGLCPVSPAPHPHGRLRQSRPPPQLLRRLRPCPAAASLRHTSAAAPGSSPRQPGSLATPSLPSPD